MAVERILPALAVLALLAAVIIALWTPLRSRRLLDTLDRLTVSYTEEQLRHLEDIFTACSRYELAFWELAWNRSK